MITHTIFVLDRKLKLILNLNNDFIPDQNELNNAARAFSSKQIQNSQINKNQLSNKIYFDFYVPIYEDNKPLAVIVLSVAPEKLLYSFFEGNHFASETGESIIFEKEDNAIINLSKLRNKNIPPLGLKIPIEKGDWTASVSSKILNKIELLKDYRGKEVLADIRYLKLMNWYLVTKIDLDEVYQSLKFKVIASSVIIFLIIGLTGLSFVFYNDKQILKTLKKVK